MTLDAYFKRPDALSRTKLAEAIGISKGRLSQLTKHEQEWPPELALRVEVATDGAIDASRISRVIAQARGLAA